jgi:NTP pyrophosphatase (non-canonical NTP hydrolase)
MRLESISERVIKQNQEIELFNNDTILSVAQMILCEALELVEATENGFLTDDLTAITSEASDCLYLLIRLFDLLGIDGRAIDIKIERNYQKYLNQTSTDEARDNWQDNGGDKAFFESLLTNDDK